ncbi:hypothetical protein HDV00_011049 [Rhizophlyctis rosea]|nr:hypothetical protein HDV00_011049 [Rhizophlyctis rosea]
MVYHSDYDADSDATNHEPTPRSEEFIQRLCSEFLVDTNTTKLREKYAAEVLSEVLRKLHERETKKGDVSTDVASDGGDEGSSRMLERTKHKIAEVTSTPSTPQVHTNPADDAPSTPRPLNIINNSSPQFTFPQEILNLILRHFSHHDGTSVSMIYFLRLRTLSRAWKDAVAAVQWCRVLRIFSYDSGLNFLLHQIFYGYLLGLGAEGKWSLSVSAVDAKGSRTKDWVIIANLLAHYLTIKNFEVSWMPVKMSDVGRWLHCQSQMISLWLGCWESEGVNDDVQPDAAKQLRCLPGLESFGFWAGDAMNQSLLDMLPTSLKCLDLHIATPLKYPHQFANLEKLCIDNSEIIRWDETTAICLPALERLLITCYHGDPPRPSKTFKKLLSITPNLWSLQVDGGDWGDFSFLRHLAHPLKELRCLNSGNPQNWDDLVSFLQNHGDGIRLLELDFPECVLTNVIESLFSYTPFLRTLKLTIDNRAFKCKMTDLQAYLWRGEEIRASVKEPGGSHANLVRGDDGFMRAEYVRSEGLDLLEEEADDEVWEWDGGKRSHSW